MTTEVTTFALLFLLIGAIILFVMMLLNEAFPAMRRLKDHLLDYNLHHATALAMKRTLTRPEREGWIRLLRSRGGNHFA